MLLTEISPYLDTTILDPPSARLITGDLDTVLGFLVLIRTGVSVAVEPTVLAPLPLECSLRLNVGASDPDLITHTEHSVDPVL